MTDATTELENLASVLGLEFEPERRAAVIAAYGAIAAEIAKLRSLDLTDVHPAVVFAAHAETMTGK